MRAAEPIAVLHVVGRMSHGGTEHRLLDLMRHVSRSEFRLDVCALSGLPGPLDDRVRALGGEVIPLPLNVLFPVRFVHLLRRRRYGAVHSHVMHMSGPILGLAAVAGVPARIAHYRSTDDGKGTTWARVALRRFMQHLVRRYATDIVGVAAGVMDSVWNEEWRPAPRFRVLYNALDPSRFESCCSRDSVRAGLGIGSAERLFVHIGRYDITKNYPRLLEIFAEIWRTEQSCRLALVGPGTDDPGGEIAARVRRLGIDCCVLPLGARDDVPALLTAADVLLLPSLWEGLPGVVLEACAAGVPVLATDLPGIREIASHFPLVRYLPLSAADPEWAKTALALPVEAEAFQLRARAADTFRASVFHIDQAVAAHRALWARAQPMRLSPAAGSSETA